MKERSAERSAACSTCGKTFARSDTLIRHEKSHLATEDRGPVHRVTNGTFRACHSCAQARSRCSGGDPCGRCKIRNLDCAYPSKRRKIAVVAEGDDVVDEKPSMHGRRVDGQLNTSSEPHNDFPGQLQLVFSHTSESSYPGSGQLEMSSTKNSNIGSISMPNTSPQLERHNSSHMQVGENAMPGVLETMAHQPQYSHDIMQHEYQNAYPGQSTNYGFEPNIEDPMSVNWIPLSVYPSPYGDMEQDLSFLLPTFSESGSLDTGFEPLFFDQATPQLPTNPVSDARMPRLIPTHTASTSILGLAQSPASSTSDGANAMKSMSAEGSMDEPRKKRRKSSYAQDAFSKPRTMHGKYEFPDTMELTFTESVSRGSICGEAQYSTIRSTFEECCVRTSSSRSFLSSVFPDLVAINVCIDLYFDRFHPSFPLLHVSSIGENTNWLLLLAVATIGSNFASIPSCADLRAAFQEFLRRAIVQSSEFDTNSFHNLQIAQARILHLVGLAQADRIQLKSLAPRHHAELSRWCLESGILQLTTPDDELTPDLTVEQMTGAWHKWTDREALRRTGYFIWLLDCAFGYLCNTRPVCNMDDARTPLPCPEPLWNATSADQWFKHKLNTPTMPSLCAVVEDMYNSKKTDVTLSEIANILMIHALYSRTWEVGTHIKQPLSEWKATGNSRGFLNTPSKDNFWLPSYPLYANWRNSACDCLDTLHWHASGVIAKAAGLEHRSVLHLHLARIILLTPFQEIQDLLFCLINHNVGEDSKATYYVHDGSYQRRHIAKLRQIRKITLRWLREDQHKARLAIVHAGSVFWHVRRYSSNSFFEPLAVYLASIVLWTYGSYKSAAMEREAAGNIQDDRLTARRRASNDAKIQPSRVDLAVQSHSSKKSPGSSRGNYHNPPSTSPHNTSNNSHHPVSDSDESDSDSDSDIQPEFIHLDRPCDDEIVQHFVRTGHSMAGYMSNVDICKTPGKVLIEGAKLLKGKLSCWGVSREFYDVLVKLREREVERES